MKLEIHSRIRQKLSQKHKVSEDEIVQCFANREKGFLMDTRENHRTEPPTRWFVAQTDFGRKLKVVFVQDASTRVVTIKTTYEANAKEIEIYDKYA